MTATEICVTLYVTSAISAFVIGLLGYAVNYDNPRMRQEAKESARIAIFGPVWPVVVALWLLWVTWRFIKFLFGMTIVAFVKE